MTKTEISALEKALHSAVMGARLSRIRAEQLSIPRSETLDVRTDLIGNNEAALRTIAQGLMARPPLVRKTGPESNLYVVVSNLDATIWMLRCGIKELPCLVLAASSEAQTALGPLDSVPDLLFGHLSRREEKKLKDALFKVSGATFATRKLDGIAALSCRRSAR